MDWIARCTTCGVELERCPNGSFATAAARHHIKDGNDGHTVLVGFEVSGDDFSPHKHQPERSAR